MSISGVKVDSIPLQFDFTGGCNCCNCRGKQTVYVNSHGEIEKFDKSKSKDHEEDFSKSLRRLKGQIDKFLELYRPPRLSEIEKDILKPIEGERTLKLRHIQTINRKLCEIWAEVSSRGSSSSTSSPSRDTQI